MTSRLWEVQECEVHGSSVRGCLKVALSFWKEEQDAPPLILDTYYLFIMSLTLLPL